MRENFLHYLWKYNKIDAKDLHSTDGEHLEILEVGRHNFNSGPDFFNAKIRIDDQLWVGNVELHIKASDWLLHQHDTDAAYDNVILHVVWDYDVDIFRRNKTKIPSLDLSQYVSNAAIENYKELFYNNSKWINCENEFKNIDDFILQRWLERLYFERLERKAKEIEVLLENSKHNWEEVLFRLLLKTFGLKLNADAFDAIARSIPFSVLRKCRSNQFSLEAVLLGQAGFLEDHKEDEYYSDLKKEYEFLKKKFKLRNDEIIPAKFFRLRPANFPTIRLSQLAQLYSREPSLFSKMISINKMNDFYKLFSITSSPFWETHYTFNKISKHSVKKLSHSFIDLIVINTVVPMRFLYAKYQSKYDKYDLIKIMGSISAEKNKVVKGFETLKEMEISALGSQALIQLKTQYCDKNKCLECEVGHVLLNRNM